MKKTVLLLMNGFGIETKESYSIYNSKLMPNLDSYTQKYLFSSIDANTYNFSNGYRIFSTGSNVALTYPLINNYQEKFNTNPNMNFFLNNITEDSNIQLFLYLQNDSSLEHLKNMIKFIREKHNNKIFLHLVLTSPDIDNYEELERMLMKIMYNYKDCRISTVIGSEVLKQRDLNTYMNLLKNQIGEKWLDVSRKFKALINSKVTPNQAKEFYVNDGYKISDKDVYFFFNYEYTDLTHFIEYITKLTSVGKYFSMFPVSGIKYPMFGYPISEKSMSNSLKKINAKALVFSEGAYIPTINYMANGLNNVMPDNIFYSRTDTEPLNKEKLKAIIKDSEYDLIIINYQVDTVETIAQLQERLSNLDIVLKTIHDICVENKTSLFISSLYGMTKELKVDNFTKAMVDFSEKVPVIVIDPVFDKTNFRLDYGNIYNLAHTIYTNINNSYNEGAVIIKKKSALKISKK